MCMCVCVYVLTVWINIASEEMKCFVFISGRAAKFSSNISKYNDFKLKLKVHMKHNFEVFAMHNRILI